LVGTEFNAKAQSRQGAGKTGKLFTAPHGLLAR